MTNTLTFRPFSLKDILSVRKLYLSAFPDNERIPLFWLLLSIWQDEYKHLQIVEHQGRFVGFAYVIECPSCLLLGYLATTSQSRSQGYGKQILWKLHNQFSLPILLNIEVVDDDADNNEMRQKRWQFYQRNGFYRTDFDLFFEDDRYWILSTSEMLTQSEIEHAFGEFIGVPFRIDKR